MERNNMKWILIGGVAFVLLSGCVLGFLLFRGLFYGGAIYMWGPSMMGGPFSWRGLGMALFSLVVLAGIIILVTIPRWSRRGGDAYAIAHERYARGEISKEEYDRILETLRVGG